MQKYQNKNNMTNNHKSFWIRKWALQPVRLCCRGKQFVRT